jgi:peroxiredoxin
MRTSRMQVGSLALILFVALALEVRAARVGDRAPDFTATDSNGKIHTLSQYAAKYVVLEWTNRGCPYTKKHYESGNMQKLQREWTNKGVIWLTIASSAPGEQGYVTASEENAYLKQVNAAPTGALLDPDGKLGHLYNAKTTPNMYVINPQGILIYAGAIDDRPTTDVEDLKSATNYVSAALEEAMSGKQVAVRVTRSYGCSIKYR